MFFSFRISQVLEQYLQICSCRTISHIVVWSAVTCQPPHWHATVNLTCQPRPHSHAILNLTCQLWPHSHAILNLKSLRRHHLCKAPGHVVCPERRNRCRDLRFFVCLFFKHRVVNENNSAFILTWFDFVFVFVIQSFFEHLKQNYSVFLYSVNIIITP